MFDYLKWVDEKKKKEIQKGANTFKLHWWVKCRNKVLFEKLEWYIYKLNILFKDTEHWAAPDAFM